MKRRRGPRSSAICTIATGHHAPLLERAIPRVAGYAAIHGFDLHAVTSPLCASRPVAWSKLLAIQALLEDYSFVWWIDADTLLVDPGRDIREEIDHEAVVNLVQHEYDGQLIPNAGMMTFRRCRAARRMLAQVWAKTEFIDHPWWENAALIDLMGYTLSPCGPARDTAFRRHINFISNDWNSIDHDPSAHPALLHYAGVPAADRLARLERDMQRYPWTT